VKAEPPAVSQTERRTPAKSPKLPQAARRDPLRLRRTMIPILLTLGVLLCGLGSAQWLADADQPYSATNLRWSAVTMPPLGVVLLMLAAWNMAFVHRRLRRRRE
jgi:hypothetical protein